MDRQEIDERDSGVEIKHNCYHCKFITSHIVSICNVNCILFVSKQKIIETIECETLRDILVSFAKHVFDDGGQLKSEDVDFLSYN